MKGLQPDEGANKVFLVVKHGTICEESKKPLAGFDAIEVKNPKTDEVVTKYIRRYRGVEALVTKIEYYDTEAKYDTRYRGIKIHLNADGVQCVLDLPEDSRPYSRFLKTAENVDFREPVEFRAWQDAEKKTAFAIKQRDENVRQRYTKDEPGEMPPPVQKRKGWDFTEQEDYLHEALIRNIIPAVEAAGNAEGDKPRPTVEAQAEQSGDGLKAGEASETEQFIRAALVELERDSIWLNKWVTRRWPLHAETDWTDLPADLMFETLESLNRMVDALHQDEVAV